MLSGTAGDDGISAVLVVARRRSSLSLVVVAHPRRSSSWLIVVAHRRRSSSSLIVISRHVRQSSLVVVACHRPCHGHRRSLSSLVDRSRRPSSSLTVPHRCSLSSHARRSSRPPSSSSSSLVHGTVVVVLLSSVRQPARPAVHPSSSSSSFVSCSSIVASHVFRIHPMSLVDRRVASGPNIICFGGCHRTSDSARDVLRRHRAAPGLVGDARRPVADLTNAARGGCSRNQERRSRSSGRRRPREGAVAGVAGARRTARRSPLARPAATAVPAMQ